MSTVRRCVGQMLLCWELVSRDWGGHHGFGSKWFVLGTREVQVSPGQNCEGYERVHAAYCVCCPGGLVPMVRKVSVQVASSAWIVVVQGSADSPESLRIWHH